MALTACGADHAKHTADITPNRSGQHSAALTEGECDLDGTWAIKITVPVRWNGNLGLQNGQGELIQYVKAQRTRDGDVIHEALTACGVTLPDYRSRMWQKFATRFPDALFDEGHIDAIHVDSHFTSFAPGATFHTDPVVSEMGVVMPSALTDPWPARGTDVQHAIDGDGDGHLGVTLVAATGDGYSLPPTSLPNFAPAHKFYTAIRNIAVINGTQQSCDWATGEASIPKIGTKLALNSHVLGCELATGEQCTPAQVRMLDDNQPAYLLNGTGTVTMVRIEDDATCETVRDFTYIRL